jgi:hypothetical protein
MFQIGNLLIVGAVVLAAILVGVRVHHVVVASDWRAWRCGVALLIVVQRAASPRPPAGARLRAVDRQLARCVRSGVACMAR